jgi:hypothetical protein
MNPCFSVRHTIALACLVYFLPPQVLAVAQMEWVPQAVFYTACPGIAGDTNTSASGAGTDRPYTLACPITPLMFEAKTVIDACALLSVATGTTAPSLQIKLKACTVQGCASGVVTNLVVPAANAGPPNKNLNGWICMKTVVRAGPSASTPTDSSFVTYPGAVAFEQDSNTIPQPLPLNTSVTQYWTFTSQWLTHPAGTTNTATLNDFYVQVTH